MKNYAESFSREWALHKYAKTKTWGWTGEQRRKFFLKQMDLKSKNLKGKSLLDAGCGNGELTIALTDYRLLVTGMDMSKSVYRARKWADDLGVNINFLRGDVANPPFKDKSFDYVFSTGVIHHTPSTKKSFMALEKLVSPGGKMFVWIYLKFDLTRTNYSAKMIWKFKFYDFIRNFISKLPSPLQEMFCYFMLFLNIYKNVSIRELREKLIFFHDAFTPRYIHRHTPEEIKSWFKEAGFRNIKITDISEKGGIGILGTKE